MKKWMIAVALIVVAVGVPLFCLVVENFTSPAPGDGSVVLIEHAKQTRGRLVNGTYSAIELDGPNYQYDAATRLLGGSGLEANDSLRIVLGVKESLSQDAGSGTDGEAYGIYELPSETGGIVVNDLSPDGTVTLTYNGSRIVLAPGERWETISTEAVSVPEYSIRYTKSDVIRNSGFVAKDSIL